MGRSKAAYHAGNVFAIPVGFYADHGFTTVLFDLDNTLDPAARPRPSPRAKDLVARLRKAGLKVLVASNNSPRRVGRYAMLLKADAFLARAGKPRRHKVLAFLKANGAKPATTVALGDQVFTDLWMARRAGLAFVLLKPLTKRDQLFTILPRLLEKPLRKRWDRKGLLGEAIGTTASPDLPARRKDG